MTIRSIAITRIAIILLVLCLSGNTRAAELVRYESTESHMGTQFRIVLYAPDQPTAVRAVRAAFARVHAIEEVLSDYRSTSEIMKLCMANDTEPNIARPISDGLCTVMQTALKLSKDSDGAFDVTVGPLTKLWRESRKSGQPSAPDRLASALKIVGYQLVHLDVAKKTLRLKLPQMRLDFGGIGKGYAADEALAVLRSHGIGQALIAASGDITVGNAPPNREAWTVEIAPITKGQPTRSLNLVNASVSTSGDLFQAVEIGGVRYSHIVNPKTGLGLTGRRSVTVVAPKGIDADSLTKAASILPIKKWTALVEARENVAAYCVVKETDNAKEVVTATKRFADYLKPRP